MIGSLSAEHEQIINATGALRRTAIGGDLSAVRAAGVALGALLQAHTWIEEQALFAQLRTVHEFRDPIEQLCAEHQVLHRLLADVVEGDLPAVARLESILRRHIDKEENGLFPAAVVELDGPSWERVVARVERCAASPADR